jgi:ferredoxin
MSRLTLHFYTGTGNSLRAARWCEEAAQARGLTTTIGQVAKGVALPPPPTGPENFLGLCYPTHAFTAPLSIIRHCLSLPRGEGARAFLIQCRAGAYAGPWPIPGLDGTGTWLLALILKMKGYRPRGWMGLDLPSNWIALHWGLSPKHVEAMSAKAAMKVGRFCDAVFSGRCWVKLDALIQLLLGLILLPITLIYLIIGKFCLAKLLFPSYRCNGCGLCAKHCPNKAIRMLSFGAAKPWPYWTWRCESCMRCMAFCPERAVECSHPLALGMQWVAALPLAYWLSGMIVPHSAAGSGALRLAIGYIYRLAAFAAVYAVFAVFNRIGPINRLFSVLTPTFFYRRYHEPQTKLQDLSIK